MTYIPLPRPESTMAERIDALKAAKPLIAGSNFLGADVLDLLRVAEYITTGHDYLDTHTDEEVSTEAEEEPTQSTVSVNIDPKFDMDATAERIARRFNLGGLGNV